MRLAEIILAGKYEVAPGADPRRRRLYSNYVRSLFGLDSNNSNPTYQVPFNFMEVLRKDLETTHAGKFGSAYVLSSFKSIAKPGDVEVEMPKKPASFRHFVSAFEQYDYLLNDNLKRSQTCATDPAVGGKGKGTSEMETTSEDELELSLLLTVALGHTVYWTQVSRPYMLLPPHDVMVSVPIISRATISNDYVPEAPLNASIPLVFSSTLVFILLRMYQGFTRAKTNFAAKRIELLARFVVYSLGLSRDDADTTPLKFVFLLKPIYQRHLSTFWNLSNPQSTSNVTEEEDKKTMTKKKDKKTMTKEEEKIARLRRLFNKRVPKELDQWITSPIKKASGEAIYPHWAEQAPEAGPEAPLAHPCGVVITESYHTTLKTLVSYFIQDRDLLERFCELVPDDAEISRAVLNEQSEVFANFVPALLLGWYECTGVVASDGLFIGPESDLCLRVY